MRVASSVDVGQARALSMLADTPIESDDEDELGFSEFADALAEVIDSPSDLYTADARHQPAPSP